MLKSLHLISSYATRVKVPMALSEDTIQWLIRQSLLKYPQMRFNLPHFQVHTQNKRAFLIVSQWKAVWTTGPSMFFTRSSSVHDHCRLMIIRVYAIWCYIMLYPIYSGGFHWQSQPPRPRPGWPFYWWPPLGRSSSRAFWRRPCRPSAITWGSQVVGCRGSGRCSCQKGLSVRSMTYG